VKNLIGKTVRIRTLDYLCAIRDKHPEEVIYGGRVTAVDGHMVRIESCRIIEQSLSREDPGTRWFNTMAESFLSIDE
jgi:hypothetical protein